MGGQSLKHVTWRGNEILIFESIQFSNGRGPVQPAVIGSNLSGLGVGLGPPEVPSKPNVFAVPRLNMILLFSNSARKEQS